MKETDVNQVSISHDRSVLAVADNTGRARLFSYPAYFPRQNYQSLDNGHVQNVIGA